jgi:hypothetical protein
LILKYFTKYDNICLQLWDEIHSEFTKDWKPNQRFAATIAKLKVTKPVNDLAMF